QDLARFLQAFFSGEIVENDTVRNRIFTEIHTPQRQRYPYYLGLAPDHYQGMMNYGHGGFWGTTMRYFPALNATISICILERDEKKQVRKVLDLFSGLLKQHPPTRFERDAQLRTYLDELTDFSGTILVAQNDAVLLERAYGLAHREHQVPNQPDTRYNIASISKLITSIATLQLHERGLLDVEKTVGTYLPDYPNERVRDSVTLAHLLTHQSGLPPFYRADFLESDKRRYHKVEDFWDLFVFDSLRFSPGSQYEYAGGGFVVLGLIIEAVTGQEYYDYVEKAVFAKAGMTNALAVPIDSVIANRASGYTSEWGEKDYYTRNDLYLAKASPAGGHYASARDLFQLTKALHDGTLLQPATRELLFTPRVRGYNTRLGYGIDVDLRHFEQIMGHSGGWYGVRAELMDFQASGYTIIVLSNQDDDGKSGASKVINDLRLLVTERFPQY
ncbi:MAG: serine hydrolase, partial [Bacteroidota bacterium]